MSASTNSSVALEVCVDSVAGVAAALHGGADRVELCANLLEGGTTPSHGTVEAAADALRGTACKLFVIIRPRGGDFVYSRSELDVMRRDVAHAAALGAHGVVFGCLTAESAIDAAATTELLELSRRHGLDATFHRAFDMTLDPAAALDALVAAGVPRVLTSGCAPSAVQGAATIKALVAQSAGRIVVMAGDNAEVVRAVMVVGWWEAGHKLGVFWVGGEMITDEFYERM